MNKKILLITGAGASKSLTASVPTDQKSNLIGTGSFREMPTGAELINQIASYQDKSLIYLISILLFDHLGVTTGNDTFLNFVRYFEFLNEEYNKVREKATEDNSDISSLAKYDNLIKSRISELKKVQQDRLERLINNPRFIITHTYFEIKFAELIEHSSVLSNLVANISTLNDNSSFNTSFQDILFLELIFCAFAYNVRLQIKQLPKSLVDLFFSDLYSNFSKVLQQFSGLYSYDNINVFDNSRRFNGFNVVVNSVYKSRNDKIDLVLKNVSNILQSEKYLNSKLEHSLDNLINQLKNFLVKLTEVSLLTELDSPTFSVDVIDLGQYNSATKEFNGLFGINIENESKRKHNINSNTIKKVNDFINSIINIFGEVKLKPKEDELLLVLSKLIELLLENGFKLSKSFPLNILLKEVYSIHDQVILFVSSYLFPEQTTISKINDPIPQLKTIYSAVSVVRHYQPLSIDYFMMNIKEVAPYEFSDTHGKKIDARVHEIHKYIKLVIANILMGHVSYAYKGRDSNNYLRHMIWKFIENAHFTNITIEEYIESSVKLINFNYDSSLLIMLFDYLHIDTLKEFSKNISHVYGELYLECEASEPNKLSKLYMCEENAIWNSLFICDDRGHKIKTENFNDHKEVYCKNLLDQITDRIKWIGENKEAETKLRQEFQKSFAAADQVYILGFGFDMNNLYNLGLLNKDYKLDISVFENSPHKVIYVSGGNARIISNLKNIFSINYQDSISDVYHLKSTNLNLDIFISKKHLPTALEVDL